MKSINFPLWGNVQRTKGLIITTLMLITCSITAQQGINYKALVKDASGNVLNGFMNVEFTIHEATAAGTIVYQEDENYTLVDGLLIHVIGTVTSPTVGIFADIDWAANTHYLNTKISYSGGSDIDVGTTQFMAVPYALHANTATTATTAITAMTADNVTGLETLDEGNGIGWRLKGQDPNNYGNIGLNATDLSTNFSTSAGTEGASGNTSTAMGWGTTASGGSSTAMGQNTEASGDNSTAMGVSTSTAMGVSTTASGDNSTAIGQSTEASGINSTAMGGFTTCFHSNGI